MRPIRFNTCNFCCIYLRNKLNNKNIECRHTSIKRCCTQGLHISFQYFAAKVLTSKLFMLLVESPFAGWFFPFKRVIKQVLIWSVFKLLVFLFAGCLFLEVPSFSGWAVTGTPPSKDAVRRVYIFPFNILLQTYWFQSFSCFRSNLLSLAGFFLLNVLSNKYWFEVFSSFWSSFLLAAFSLKFLVLAVVAVNLSGKSKT